MHQLGAAKRILMSTDHSKLTEFGGHVDLSRQCGLHLLSQVKFVRRKDTTSKSRPTQKDFFLKMKEAFLGEVLPVITIKEILLSFYSTEIKQEPTSLLL